MPAHPREANRTAYRPVSARRPSRTTRILAIIFPRDAGIDQCPADVLAIHPHLAHGAAVRVLEGRAHAHLAAVEQIGEPHCGVDTRGYVPHRSSRPGFAEPRRRRSSPSARADGDGRAVEHAIGPGGVVALAEARRPRRGGRVVVEDRHGADPDHQHGERGGEQQDSGDAAPHLPLARLRLGLNRVGVGLRPQPHRLAPDARRPLRRSQREGLAARLHALNHGGTISPLW